MEVQIIIEAHNVPECVQIKRIESFEIFPATKEIFVNIYDSSYGSVLFPNQEITRSLNFSEITTNFTGAEKLALRHFFKVVAAYALDASENDIIGDLAQ